MSNPAELDATLRRVERALARIEARLDALEVANCASVMSEPDPPSMLTPEDTSNYRPAGTIPLKF